MEDLSKANEDLRKHRDTLLALLECPVCLETCLPPITMCPNGHIVCSSCLKNLKSCPTCRAPEKPNIKNSFAEAFVAEYGGPCNNQKYGCKMFVLTSEMSKHLLDCEYRYECYTCKQYQGGLPGLLQHTSTRHRGYFFEGRDWEETTSVGVKVNRRLISCYDSLFIYVIKLDVWGLCIYVRYIGPRQNAAKYKCWFKFISESGEVKCSFLVRCRDTGVSFDNMDYFVVDTNIFKKIKKRDDTVHYKIKILESDGK